MREGIRSPLGNFDGPGVLDHAQRVVGVVQGDFSRHGDGVRGLGRRRGGHRFRRDSHESCREWSGLCCSAGLVG